MSEQPTGHSEAQGGEATAREVMSVTRERMGEVKQGAASMAEAGKERLAEKAEGKRDLAAREVRTLSKALHSAAAEAEGHDSLLTAPMRQLASTCEDLADKLEGKDSRQIMAELEELGRRQPAGFFVASVALGFLGTRFLRAGGEEQ